MTKRNCLKILVILGLALLLMCVFNVNINFAYAANEVNQEYLDSLIKILPDEVELDISEKQAMQEHIVTSKESLIGNKKLKEQITLIFAQNNIDITALKEQNIEFDAWITEDLKGEIGLIVYNPSGHLSANKTIKIIYNNSNNHNIVEETKVMNVIKNNIPKYYIMTIDKNGNRDLDPFEVVENYYSNLLNDSSITFNATSRAGGLAPFVTGYTGAMQVFKGDLFCGTIGDIGNGIFLDKIIIPENIENTDEAYIKYSLPIVKKALSKYVDGEVSLKAGNDEFINNKYYTDKVSNSIIDSFYTVTLDGNTMGPVILEKEKTTETEVNIEDTVTNIKLETTKDIVPEGTQLIVNKVTAGNEYVLVENSLKDTVSKIVVYDISLQSNGVDIQPNGKVKISIPIPKDYNKANLVVYRIDENGTKTEYAVKILDNYAVFETDHFSTYVLAEKANIEDNTQTETPQEEEKQDTTNEHIKDETPKTGSNDIATIVCSILSALSAAGIAIVKKF